MDINNEPSTVRKERMKLETRYLIISMAINWLNDDDNPYGTEKDMGVYEWSKALNRQPILSLLEF